MNDQSKITTLVVKIVKAESGAITYERFGTNLPKMHFTQDKTLHYTMMPGTHYLVIARHDGSRWRWIEYTAIDVRDTLRTNGD